MLEMSKEKIMSQKIKLKQGDKIFLKGTYGNIHIRKFHSIHNEDHINVYLYFNKQTNHVVLERVDKLITREKALALIYAG